MRLRWFTAGLLAIAATGLTAASFVPSDVFKGIFVIVGLFALVSAPVYWVFLPDLIGLVGHLVESKPFPLVELSGVHPEFAVALARMRADRDQTLPPDPRTYT